MAYWNSVLVELIGNVNNVNMTFETPTKYVSGSIRVIWNGQVYDPNDVRKGWFEVDENTIELASAPRTGDILQAFYSESESEHVGLDNVIGTPFNPEE